MPQLSTRKLIVLDAKTEKEFLSDIQEALRKVRHELENEVAEAIVGENIALAERLVFPITRLRKLSDLIRQGA